MIEVRPMGNAMQLELLTKGASVAVSTSWFGCCQRQAQGPTRLAEDGRGNWQDEQARDAGAFAWSRSRYAH